MVSAGGVTMANLPHVCRNFRRSSSSDSLIISDILYSPSNHSHLRAMSFKTLCEGIPQDGLSLFQSALQQTKRRHPALDATDKFSGRTCGRVHRAGLRAIAKLAIILRVTNPSGDHELRSLSVRSNPKIPRTTPHIARSRKADQPQHSNATRRRCPEPCHGHPLDAATG